MPQVPELQAASFAVIVSSVTYNNNWCNSLIVLFTSTEVRPPARPPGSWPGGWPGACSHLPLASPRERSERRGCRLPWPKQLAWVQGALRSRTIAAFCGLVVFNFAGYLLLFASEPLILGGQSQARCCTRCCCGWPTGADAACSCARSLQLHMGQAPGENRKLQGAPPAT